MTDPDPSIVKDLEAKAIELAKLLNSRESKRPLIIEFSGTPKSGKTMAISSLRLFLRRNGIRAEAFTERASVAPLKTKGHMNFNVWVSCASLQGMLEALDHDIDIFILDRGLFDALVWNAWLELTGKITADESRTMARFFAMNRWMTLVDLVYVVQCDPKVSIEREFANQLTTKRGTIMDETILGQLNQCMVQTISKYRKTFKNVRQMDTTSMSPKEGVARITEDVLDILRHFLDEPLCVIRKEALKCALPEKGFLDDPQLVETFLETIAQHKEFHPRSAAEKDPNYLIPIPCGVVMWDGKVLLLKKKDEGHALHDTYAIWAGGHVLESDDGQPGSAEIIVNGLRRELSEELFIRDDYKATPIGLVRTDEDPRASRHIGIVYRVDLSSPHVALALHQKEFRKTRGKSMSGRLVAPELFEEIYKEMGDWSKFIVDRFWRVQRTLFKS